MKTPGNVRLRNASAGHAGLRTRNLLFLLFTVYCSLFTSLAFCSQPPFRGQYEITAIDGDTNTGWRLIGVFDDSSLQGYGAADATNGDLLFCSSSLGDLDVYAVTNIVAVTGVNLIIDVIYNEPGTPRSGAPEAGYQILARPLTNGVVPILSGASFQKYSTALWNDSVNMALYYAYLSASTNGGGSGSCDLTQWSTNNALQQIVWLATNSLIVTGAVYPDVTGIYLEQPAGHGGNRAWAKGDWRIIFEDTPSTMWRIVDATTSSVFYAFGSDADPTHYAYQEFFNSTGTAYAVWSTNIWRAGYNEPAGAWQITRDGVVLLDATNCATLAQFLAHVADTNNPHGLTAVQLGGIAGASIAGGSVTTNAGLLSFTITAGGDMTTVSNAIAAITNDVGVLQTNTATKAQGTTADAALARSGGVATNLSLGTALNAAGKAITNADYIATTGATTKIKGRFEINGTTNQTTMVITGVGFKPKGCIVDAAVINTVIMSRGFVDSSGSDYCNATYSTSLGTYTAEAAFLAVGAGYHHLYFSSWDEDGATFTRSKENSPNTNNVSYVFFFFR